MVLNYYISILANKEISICNKPIILYRGDCNIELRFEFRRNEDIINEVGAKYAQLLISMPDGDIVNITDVNPIVNGKIVVNIIAQYIDEIIELGDYDFQIRLFDSEKTARLTIPPVLKGIRVREPIVSDSNVDVSKVDEAYLLAVSEPEETFIDDAYNKTEWKLGDIITSSKMNKIEDGIYQVNEKVNAKADADYVSENYALKSEIPSLDDFDLENYATKDYVGAKIAEAQLGGGTDGDGNVNIDLSVYALKSDVPTKVSQLTNDKGYLTEHQSLAGYATEDYVTDKIAEAQLNGGGSNVDLSEYAKKSEIPTVPTNVSAFNNDAGYLKAIPGEYITESELNAKGYLTQHQSLENYATKTYVDNKLGGITRIEVVDELPGTEETGVLYIVKGK